MAYMKKGTKTKQVKNGKRSSEILVHFSCGHCGKWWTIGDAPSGKEKWFCPWCGVARERKRKKVVRLSVAAKKLKLGIYEHCKGGRYAVIGVALHSETLEEMVVYRAMYGEHLLYVRPFVMFVEKIERNGKQAARFKYISRS